MSSENSISCRRHSYRNWARNLYVAFSFFCSICSKLPVCNIIHSSVTRTRPCQIWEEGSLQSDLMSAFIPLPPAMQLHGRPYHSLNSNVVSIPLHGISFGSGITGSNHAPGWWPLISSPDCPPPLQKSLQSNRSQVHLDI